MGCSDTDYAYLREIVLSQSANLIDPSRNALFDMRLTPIARLAGASNLQGLVDLLKTDQPAHLRRAVAEAMTINETSFFRDVRPFEALRKTILPRLIAEHAGDRTLRIWCAACSTGQEAYSIGMLILEEFPELADWDVRIVGTDISRQVLEVAQKGWYRRAEVARGLSTRLLAEYFERHGEEWEISPRVKTMCEFFFANLCAPLPKLPVFDVVLLRNVLLYFPEQDRSCVLSDVYRQMRSSGYLMLGNAEQAEDSTNLFEMEFAQETYFYRPVEGG